jgi:hypothetical protein
VLLTLPKGLLAGPMVSTSLTAGFPKLAWFQMLKRSVVGVSVVGEKLKLRRG